MRGVPNYRRGYMGRDYHVTGGHEAEAESAQKRERPTRIGLFILRKLGFKGTVAPPLETSPFSPRHEKRHRS